MFSSRKLALILAIGLVCASQTFAALSATSVFEVRLAGSDTNGGGYVTGSSGNDMSQYNNANLALCTNCYSSTTDLSTTVAATTTTTTLTCATCAFGTDIVGNIVYLAIGGGSCVSGTVNAQWRQVAARTNTTTITLDVTPTGSGNTCTGVTINIGGALASPGQAAALMVAGNIAYLYNAGSSVFSITSASTNVSGGTLSLGAVNMVVGYSTNRFYGNTDTPPTIQLNVSTATICGVSSVGKMVNINFDGNSQTAAKLTSGCQFEQGQAKNFNTASSSTSSFKNFGFTANSATVAASTTCTDCEAWANTATPFNVATCVRCTSASNTGSTTDGFSGFTTCDSCVSVSNGHYGFNMSNGAAQTCENCIAESNTSQGFDCANGVKTIMNSSTFGNSAATTGTCTVYNSLGGSTTAPYAAASSVFVNAPTNLALNNTASAGAALRAKSYPGVWPRGTTTTYLDMGPIQSQATGGGSIGIVGQGIIQ